jgi:hypothetical protein
LSERPEASQKSSSFALSIVLHGVIFGLLFYGLLHPPPMKPYKLEERLIVRSLELHLPDPEKPHAPGGSPSPKAPDDRKNTQGEKAAAQLATLRQTVDAPVAHQTLLQPKLKNLVKLQQDVPLPTVVLWNQDAAMVKSIIPPPPVKLAAAEVLAAPQLPNREERLADVRINSSDLSTQKLPILPSTTSPVVVHGPDLPQQVPSTSSTSTQTPTPAAVVSINDMRMDNGKVILPAADTSSASSAPGVLTQGKGDTDVRSNNTNPSNSAGTGGTKVATAANGSTSSGVGAKVWPAQGNGNGTAPRAGIGSENNDSDSDNPQPTNTRITLPRNGVFGSVVVGVSLVDKYPETARLWGGKMAYTVYLHVGLAKSWILQYSLPSGDDAAKTDNSAHLDAPWPYNIMRPNIPSSILNADALMVHGFVNADGHFEQLKVVFPPEFPQSQFVLDSLNLWEFRPATQGGQKKRVEVVLIIPDIE